jgi:hypothetical protein
MRKCNLYKWKLIFKDTREIVSEHFVIDRGDNKRASSEKIYNLLIKMSKLENSSDHKNKLLTIGGFEEFKAYPGSYNCKV